MQKKNPDIKMDPSYSPPNVGNPPNEQKLELWTGGECIRGYKKEGRWFAEDGTTINIDGWRLVEKPKDPEKAEADAKPQARPFFEKKPDPGPNVTTPKRNVDK